MRLEAKMIEMSADAKKELDNYFEGKEKGTIRMYLAPGGCSGPRLALALDDAAPEDKTEEVDGYKFCIDEKLADEIGGAKIKFSDMGFEIVPEKPLPESAGGGCGGCCGGCGGN